MTGKFRGASAGDVLPGMRPLEIFNLNLDGRQELAWKCRLHGHKEDIATIKKSCE